MDRALMVTTGTSVATSALLLWCVRRIWVAVSALSTMASKVAASSEMLTAQAQTQTAHAALLAGSVDTLRRDLAFDEFKFFEGDDK